MAPHSPNFMAHPPSPSGLGFLPSIPPSPNGHAYSSLSPHGSFPPNFNDLRLSPPDMLSSVSRDGSITESPNGHAYSSLSPHGSFPPNFNDLRLSPPDMFSSVSRDGSVAESGSEFDD